MTALSSAERRAEAKRKEQVGYSTAIIGLFACAFSSLLSPEAFRSLQALPDNLDPIEYLDLVLQAVKPNFSELPAVRVAILAIGLAQFLFSINVIWEANEMKKNMTRNR